MAAVTDTSSHVVNINIRGRLFEVERNYLLRQESTGLRKIANTDPGETVKLNRNTLFFECVLDYCESGHLHLPLNMCLGSVKNELDFWGISEKALDECCFLKYKEYYEALSTRNKMQSYWNFHENMKCSSSKLIGNKDLKSRVFLIISEPMSSTTAMIWAAISFAMNMLAILVVIVETMPSMRVRPTGTFDEYFNQTTINGSSLIMFMVTNSPVTWLIVIEFMSVAFLTIEVILSAVTSSDRARFLLDLHNVFDILSLIPSYCIMIMLPIISSVPLTDALVLVFNIFVALRIIRVFRIINLAKCLRTVQIIFMALKESYKEFCVLLALLMSASVFFASILFYVEIQYDNIATIPLAIWWALVTMTTLGYGDYYPVSAGGYVVASLCVMTGILIFALPVPIIVSNFNRLYKTYKDCQMLAERKSA